MEPSTEIILKSRYVNLVSFLVREIVQLHIRVTYLTQVLLLPRCQNLGSTAYKGNAIVC